MTINQVIKGARQPKKQKLKTPILKTNGQNCPFRVGVVEKVLIRTPKKPNSAQRKAAIVRINVGKGVVKRITAYIPDMKHTIQSHATVKVQGGAAQDLPGIRVSICRGQYDAAYNKDRKNKRSKYGVPKPTKK